MYEYWVLACNHVVDGDTVDATIDLGFGLHAEFRFRLAGINAPEMSTPQGPAARDFTETWFHQHVDHPMFVQTRKHSPVTAGIGDGAYGRWLGYFFAQTNAAGTTYSALSYELLHADLGVVEMNPWTP